MGNETSTPSVTTAGSSGTTAGTSVRTASTQTAQETSPTQNVSAPKKDTEDIKNDLTRLAVMGTEGGDCSAKKNYPIGPDGKRLKPCCACPETKRARDACIIEKGQENCTELIEAHKACMRSLGFNI